MTDDRRITRAERKALLNRLQAAGMNRADARRVMYGPGWKERHPTRRAELAQAIRLNARKRKEADGASAAREVSEQPEGETEGQARDDD